MLLARPLLGNPPEPLPRTHCLLLLELGGAPWIADGGFGGAYCPPLPLTDGAEAVSGDGAAHRLRRIGVPGSLPGEWLLERRGPVEATDGRIGAADQAGWVAQFAFDLTEVPEADLAMGNHWSSTHPAARFVNAHVVSLCLADGFAGLVDRTFSLYRVGQAAERREIGTAAEYGALLEQVFGLALPREDVARLPLFARA
jgi:N-hydroxyarylamine O-acetyltransferase